MTLFHRTVLDDACLYRELAVQVMEICIATRERNGGLISVQDVLKRITKKNIDE